VWPIPSLKRSATGLVAQIHPCALTDLGRSTLTGHNDQRRRAILGQAKHRGTQEERIAAAVMATALNSPPTIACNGCNAVLPQAERLDTQELKGIELAFKSHCAACDQDTWAVRGEVAAVKAFYAALEKSVGGTVQLGSAKPPLNS
jgi:hypothetical protein